MAGSTPARAKIIITVLLSFYSLVFYCNMRLIQFNVYEKTVTAVFIMFDTRKICVR